MRKYIATWEKVGAEFEPPGPQWRLISSSHENIPETENYPESTALLCVWEDSSGEWVVHSFEAKESKL